MAYLEIVGYCFKRNQSQAEHRWQLFKNSRDRELSDVYVKCSAEKHDAYRKCLKIMLAVGGDDLRITGHNCDFFTCSFVTTDAENGNINRIYWFTHKNNYYADL